MGEINWNKAEGGSLTLSRRGLSETQILSFPTPFRASQYLNFWPSESTIRAHRMILNVHFRHKKFVDEVRFAKVHKTRPKLKMTQISTCIQQFEVLSLWAGKLLQITCYLFVNFLFFFHSWFPVILSKFHKKEKSSQNLKINKSWIFEKCKIFNYKVAERWGAKPLSFLRL